MSSNIQGAWSQVDTVTLRDLEILSPASRGGQTLLRLLDRTRSQLGHAALRERLHTISGSRAHLMALQSAYDALAKRKQLYREYLERCGLDHVERYLCSPWQLPLDRPILTRLQNRLVPPYWFRRYQEDVEEGQLRVRALLRSVQDLSDSLASEEASPLRDIAFELTSLFSTEPVQQVWRLAQHGSVSAREMFDQWARERAKSQLLAILQCLARLEAMWSLGVAPAEHGWTYPNPTTRWRITGLFHPFIGSAVTPNDIDLDAPVRVCFITGPNMAGKSTFLRAFGIATLLAHIGCAVPASTMDFVPVSMIFSSGSAIESLEAKESYYLAEVRRLKALASQLHVHRTAFAILDEPLRGTNVHDAAEAMSLIVSQLATMSGSLFLVSSHLTDDAERFAHHRILYVHFSADLSREPPAFGYKLQPGISTQRLGVALLRQEGVLELFSSVMETPIPAQEDRPPEST